MIPLPPSTPERPAPWIDDHDAAMLTDLYELTMLRVYFERRITDEAVFSLFVRRLPEHRNFLLACGLDDALRYLETLRFPPAGLEYLRGRDEFSDDFVDWLADFRFTGDVYAVPEGTPVFADEPLLEVVAPVAEGQIAETFLMNQLHHQTVIASKAARVMEAAAGRRVIDFGLRRMHGTDAGVKSARAFHVAGLTATSNVFAGWAYGVPIAGTMAHSFIQTFDDELDAFRAFVRTYPETILLVDTYDTLGGVRKVVELARELGEDFRVRGIRLDSGDLVELAFAAREILDAAGLEQVEIFASGGLDEYEIAEILGRGAPITGFGVGTGMGVSSDAPSLDFVYKLTSYAGEGRLKTSPGKLILPGRKQVFRVEEDGMAVRDLLARHDEAPPPGARPLLHKVMEGGRRLDASRRTLDQARQHARDEIARLPERIRRIEPADPPYPVEVSDTLARDRDQAIAHAGD